MKEKKNIKPTFIIVAYLGDGVPTVLFNAGDLSSKDEAIKKAKEISAKTQLNCEAHQLGVDSLLYSPLKRFFLEEYSVISKEWHKIRFSAGEGAPTPFLSVGEAMARFLETSYHDPEFCPCGARITDENGEMAREIKAEEYPHHWF